VDVRSEWAGVSANQAFPPYRFLPEQQMLLRGRREEVNSPSHWASPRGRVVSTCLGLRQTTRPLPH
jgi:hypothetical protein